MTAPIQTVASWLGSGSINIFGRPFAGKDTQGRVLAELLGGEVISGGDILRHSQNPVVQQIMAEGGIIPSDLFESIVVPYLSRPEFDNKPIILSEVGRLAGEQLVIMRATARTGHPQKAVVLLNLSDDEVFSRFEAAKMAHDRGKRADDRREVLQTRLDNYEAKVRPVIEFYRQNGLLVEVDGSLERKQVTSGIIKGLAERAVTI